MSTNQCFSKMHKIGRPGSKGNVEIDRDLPNDPLKNGQNQLYRSNFIALSLKFIETFPFLNVLNPWDNNSGINHSTRHHAFVVLNYRLSYSILQVFETAQIVHELPVSIKNIFIY